VPLKRKGVELGSILLRTVADSNNDDDDDGDVMNYRFLIESIEIVNRHPTTIAALSIGLEQRPRKGPRTVTLSVCHSISPSIIQSLNHPSTCCAKWSCHRHIWSLSIYSHLSNTVRMRSTFQK